MTSHDAPDMVSDVPEPEIARGLEGIVLTETRLSRIDGEAGELVIGGFPLEELAPKASFEEVLFLLWHDRLPSAQQLAELHKRMAASRGLPEPTLAVLRASAASRLDPMDALLAGTATLSLADSARGDQSPAADLERAGELVARLPSIVAAYWRMLRGREPVEPDPELRHAANYLYMLTGEPPDEERVRGLESYLNTVVDHGMNASTFTSRVIASTRSDMISAVVGAIAALKGPAHGGAPGPALDMVFDVRERAARSGRSLAEEADGWVREAVESGERIMGFGHRVYRVRDPRADVLDGVARQLFEGASDRSLYRDALSVERVALDVLEELKPGRRLQTNVEFYTALVLYGAGLELPLFTPTFAVSRVGGWTAHFLEQADENRLIRPRVAYRGALDRAWVPPEGRA